MSHSNRGTQPPGSSDPPPARAHQLWAPWRLSYLEMLAQAAPETSAAGVPPPHAGPAASAPASCFLRRYWLDPASDAPNHVVVRTGNGHTSRGGMILLNRYPYSNGHLLVCLGDSRPRLLDYSAEERAELWSMVDLATDLLERSLMPQGVNIGLNQGSAAGAGVPEHVHIHVVPRWGGDVNFMSACANIRVIPSSLEAMARRLREVWDQVKPSA